MSHKNRHRDKPGPYPRPESNRGEPPYRSQGPRPGRQLQPPASSQASPWDGPVAYGPYPEQQGGAFWGAQHGWQSCPTCGCQHSPQAGCATPASKSWGDWRGDERGDRDYRERDGASEGPHAGRGPRNYRRGDDRIEEDVNERLARHGQLDAYDIEVDVVDGIVTLSGMVDDRSSKRLAEDIAEDVTGVKQVVNMLRARSTTRDTARNASMPSDESREDSSPVTPKSSSGPTRELAHRG